MVQDDADEPNEIWVAFTRIFSGKLRVGDKVFVMGPKYDALAPDKHVSEATVSGIFLFMGRDLLPLDEAGAGCIVGIVGLNGHVLKCATLSSSPQGPPFHGMYMHVKPIVRVALETSISNITALKDGMKLLSQADPCVEIYVQSSGEHVLVGAGEVHIERCLTDLRTLFCPGIDIKVSPPIIPFRETVIVPPSVDMMNETIGETNTVTKRQHYLFANAVVEDSNGIVTVHTQKKRWAVQVRVSPLSQDVTAFLEDNTDILKDLTGWCCV